MAHNRHRILAAVTVLLAVDTPEAGRLVVYVSVSPPILCRLCSCHTGILVVVDQNSQAVEVHNSAVVEEDRNTAVVEDSHAADPGQGKTTW